MAQTLMTHGQGTRTPQANLRQLVEAYERRLIIEALVRAHGNQRRAAAELGCLPTTLNEKMRRARARGGRRARLSSDDPQREDAAARAAGVRPAARREPAGRRGDDGPRLTPNR